jgi:hypothetical protein
MNPRYAPGGDIYQELASQYGPAAADRVYRAARDGGDIATVLGDIRNPGIGGSTSTTSILLDQLATNPLGAPLESVNRTLGNTVWSFLKAPWVLLLLVVLALLYFWPVLRTVFAKRAS